MTHEEMFDQTLNVAKTLAHTTLESTPKSTIGILGAVLAAVALARSENWSEAKLEEAWRSAMEDLYREEHKPLTLDA